MTCHNFSDAEVLKGKFIAYIGYIRKEDLKSVISILSVPLIQQDKIEQFKIKSRRKKIYQNQYRKIKNLKTGKMHKISITKG